MPTPALRQPEHNQTGGRGGFDLQRGRQPVTVTVRHGTTTRDLQLTKGKTLRVEWGDS
jgi:hypothetical protein